MQLLASVITGYSQSEFRVLNPSICTMVVPLEAWDNRDMKDIKLSDSKAPLQRGGYYPLASWLHERPRSFEVPEGIKWHNTLMNFYTPESHRVAIYAHYTGEKRPPKKGEYYLSGAIIEAYRAPNDLSTPYPIAKLVYVVEEVVTRTYVIQ